jgi:hypothetical protein
MPIQDAMSRISQIELLIGRVGGVPARPAPAAAAAPTAATAATPFQQLLAAQPAAAGGTAGARLLQAAQTQVGQREEPPGSNDGAAIAAYRSAVAGSVPGAPWCAYFVSWAARQAGTPLGDAGEGFGAVSQIHDWAERTGRLLPPGAQPAPGDIILFGSRHVGIVERVNPDGSLQTVEGNSSSAVSRVSRSAGEATGFVRL